MLENMIGVRTRRPGDLHYIDFLQGDKVALSLGPYENPGLAKREAKQLRAYIEHLLEQAKSEERHRRR